MRLLLTAAAAPQPYSILDVNWSNN